MKALLFMWLAFSNAMPRVARTHPDDDSSITVEDALEYCRKGYKEFCPKEEPVEPPEAVPTENPEAVPVENPKVSPVENPEVSPVENPKPATNEPVKPAKNEPTEPAKNETVEVSIEESILELIMGGNSDQITDTMAREFLKKYPDADSFTDILAKEVFPLVKAQLKHDLPSSR